MLPFFCQMIAQRLGRGCNSPPPFGRVTSEPFSPGHDWGFSFYGGKLEAGEKIGFAAHD